MPESKKITPFGLISSITTLAAFIGIVFTVDARYVTKAEASEKTSEVVQQQQLDRVETDLALIELELNFLQEKVDRQRQATSAPPQNSTAPRVIDDEPARRINYLEQRRMILEKYQLELQIKE